jgi:hypothetical protein
MAPSAEGFAQTSRRAAGDELPPYGPKASNTNSDANNMRCIIAAICHEPGLNGRRCAKEQDR